MRLIEIPQWGNVTLIEALWLASGVFAFVVASIRFRAIHGDYFAAVASGEKDLRVLAGGYLRREIIRLGQASLIIGIGAYAAYQPSAIPGPARVSITGLVITAALILISLLVALQSIFDWRDRGEVRHLLEDE